MTCELNGEGLVFRLSGILASPRWFGGAFLIRLVAADLLKRNVDNSDWGRSKKGMID